MAISLRELPAPVQVVLAVLLAIVIFAVGEFVPGLPIQAVRAERDNAQKQLAKLNLEVNKLQVNERERTQLANDIKSLQTQIDNLKNLIPDDKQTDEFIKDLSDSARAAKVSIRRLTPKAVESKDYYMEAPFEVAVDGPYFDVLDFFTRIHNLSRVINVADLVFVRPDSQYQGGPTPPPFPLRPGTTVYGTFMATTYYVGGKQGPATAKPGQKPGAGPARH